MSGRLVRGAVVGAVVLLAAVACVPVDPGPPLADTDGDRLADVYETNSGVYVGATNTGTDPAVADTDDDGIADGDEVLGTTAGLDLPAMGTNPLRKDLIAEFDWFDDNNTELDECAAHSHRPGPAVIDTVVDAFAAGTTTNPDGTTGVNFIADYGQGGVFTGGALIADVDGVIAGEIGDPDFTAIKAANFASNRAGYVRYVLDPHAFRGGGRTSGQAEIIGDDVIVSLGCSVDNNLYLANTIMHELGHNLSLLHGGDDVINYKPNYLSVMNYLYQFVGVDTDCDAEGDGATTFSLGALPVLDEYQLIEADGICGPGGPAIDWNWNDVIDPDPVPVSINGDSVGDVLHDHDDWSALDLSAGLMTGAQRRGPAELSEEQPVPG